jgi:hypothetical protein
MVRALSSLEDGRPDVLPRYLHGSLAAMATLGGIVGCAASAPVHPPQPAGLPPTPATVTVQHPGGDAADPERAALERLAAEPWGSRRDRPNTLRVPLVDARHWQRVKLWGYPTRAAFRFGDEHFGITAIWYLPTPGRDDPDACLDRFIADARPAAEAYGVQAAGIRRVHTTQRSGPVQRPVVIQVIDGSVESLFDSGAYVGALAAYQSWPGTCLIQGFVVVADKHRELAVQVRDRWVTQGAARLTWSGRVTEAPPLEDR